jgi:hypothetical protein
MYGGVDVKLHALLISAKMENNVIFTPQPFYFQGMSHGTHQ